MRVGAESVAGLCCKGRFVAVAREIAKMHKHGMLTFLLWVVVLSCGPVIALAECRKLVATGNSEYPPYLWRNPNNPQQLIGVNADLLKHLAKEMGVSVDIIYAGPWSRAQEEVRAGRIDMIAGAFFTWPRLEVMDYLHPPFLFTSSVVWVRQGEGFHFEGWKDLEGHRGGTLLNSSQGQQFDNYARDHLYIEEVPGLRQVFQKLLLGRNDYVVYEYYPGLAYAKMLQMEERLEVLKPPISREALYFTLSHKSACNTVKFLERLEGGLTKIVSSDLPEQLLKRNLALWQSYQTE